MAFIRIQFRRGTASEWTTANPVLASGEMGIETDTNQFKIGDGTTAWNDLNYGGLTGPGLIILGELNNVSELPNDAAAGTGYIIGGDLYVWSGEQWNSAGRIVGPSATGITRNISLSGTSFTVTFSDYSIQTLLDFRVFNSNNDIVELAANINSDRLVLNSNINLADHTLQLVYLE